MRADSLPRFSPRAGCLALLSLFVVAAAGCKTERDADDPIILGVPPVDAYLGVEYAYNFGAFDSDDILDYSLTNAPSWLALEDTSNKARQGVIMRGVPGLTGGNRERDDLGTTENITLVANDGRASGSQSFEIEVQENVLSLAVEDFTEGEAAEVPEERDNRCEAPELGELGSHSYEANIYGDDGSVTGTEQRTRDTYPVLVRVLLDQPSVTRVAVAFELDSSFNPQRCDDGFDAPHQRCENGAANDNEAIIGKDIVGLGSGSEGALPVPSYLEYQPGDDGFLSKGVITLEPGITECYIRLEVIEDAEAEPLETLNMRLIEVRSGLAGLGSSNSGVRELLRIKDNEPSVRLETVAGGTRDAINVGQTREYRALISGERLGTYSVKLGEDDDSEAVLGEDFFIEVRNTEGQWDDGDILAFREGIEEVGFRIRVPATYTNGQLENDRAILLGLDERYQAGRENFAASADADKLRVNINELTSPLAAGTENGFVPTDTAIGHNGRLFVAGYRADDSNRPWVRIYSQKGNMTEQQLSVASVSVEAPPVIGFAEREVEEGGDNVTRYEFVVSFGSEQTAAGDPGGNGVDFHTLLYFFDTAQDPDSYVPVWETVVGTSGNDFPRWTGIDPDTGFVVNAGETSGQWPGESAAGGVDSFLQRIDTEKNGDLLTPKVAWTRQVGSARHDKSVVGGSAETSSPLLLGSSAGAVMGQLQKGGEDAFFYIASSKDSDITVNQRGTTGNETLADGIYGINNVWLVGNSDGDYRVDSDEGDRSLERSQLGSQAGFVLSYTVVGDVTRGFTFNDQDDASKEVLNAVITYEEDILVAGSTNGDFVDSAGNSLVQPIIARISLSEDSSDGEEDGDETDSSREWRKQVSVGSEDAGIVHLENYRDDEIIALVKVSGATSDRWEVRLFTGEGRSLH
ncbi:hypothetical protein FDP08_01535 [Marinobacter panjinensis]|uniref:Dystroglycan-type cadherin-like domain-containing protein n=1 Tax=Marinobacter panjinensis TaxID=2576384 RepID=A0A4U6R251_9GAMM|nr:hypothetical protein [Marinobacter panjinensis]MCR8915617.1 hypothetical protein [Marinobacter panjinensis]TKV66862.1 hypothetical protein FDP08_01535 [Marinobacter panjinensis]